MELKTNLIHRNYKKCDAKNQIAIGDDFSVPEGCPDVSEILMKKAKLHIEEVHTEKGKLKIRGFLKFHVLYLTQRDENAAAGLSGEFPFDEVLYMDGASSGDNLKLDWSIDDFKVSIIHPGKLGIRALVTLCADASASESHLIAESISDTEEVPSQTLSCTAAEPVFNRKDSYRIRDEVSLPANKPNVSKILWSDLQLRGPEISIRENKLVIQGELLLFVLYQGEESGSMLHWLEHTIPFQGALDVTGLTTDMFGNISFDISRELVELKPDYDGELRMFQIEMTLDIHMNLFQEQTFPVLTDAYSIRENLLLTSQPIRCEKLRLCTQAVCRVTSSIECMEESPVLQVLSHQAELLNLQSQVTEQGILCEGNLAVQILYVTGNDKRPFGSASVSIPFRHLLEIAQIDREDIWQIQPVIEKIQVSMADANHMEIRGTLRFHTCVMQQCSINNITELTASPYDADMIEKLPAMKIHFVQPQETLWSIAKENHITMEEIKKTNEFTHAEVLPGQKLLLLKQIEAAK